MNVASTKARLKNIAEKNGKNFQDILIAYGLERTIYRLSKSKYLDRFVLKGGIFLYAISGGNYARATVDIDLLAQNISNDVDDMKNVFRDIFAMQMDDALQYDLDTIEVSSITEFKEYHGVNISIIAYLDKTKIPVSIDVGFGDVIYPNKVSMDFPTLLEEEVPHIYAYSLASSIAEKFEAIVSLGYDNSRFKDFYDIYILGNKYSFDGAELVEALKETFEHRKTSVDTIVAFEPGFANDGIILSRWKNFAKKKKISLDVSLQDTIDFIICFISPLVKVMQEDKTFSLQWNPEIKKWE